MQAPYSDERNVSVFVGLSVRLSVHPSVKRVNVTKQKKVLPTFLYHKEDGCI